MKNLIEAVIKVTKEVGNIEKSFTVGAGRNSYKGVADKDVKKAIGEAMTKNGLAMFTIKIEPTVRIDRWEEENNYKQLKQKQSVFTEVLTTYKLYHKSGEYIELMGYGQGVDSQDKSAGKATTYALKYALLYQFMIVTGTVEDTEKTHSENIEVPQKTQQPAKPEKKQEPKKEPKTPTVWITNDQFEKAILCVDPDKVKNVINQFKLRPEQQEELQEIYNNLKSKSNK